MLEDTGLRRLWLAGTGIVPIQARQLARARERRPLEIHAGCNPQLAPALVEELARGPPAPYDYVDSL